MANPRPAPPVARARRTGQYRERELLQGGDAERRRHLAGKSRRRREHQRRHRAADGRGCRYGYRDDVCRDDDEQRGNDPGCVAQHENHHG